MKALNMVCHIDTNGRVSVPKGIRDMYNFQIGQPLEFIPKGDGLIEVRKFPLHDRVVEGAKDLHNLVKQHSEHLDPEYVERIDRHLKMVIVLMNKAVRDSEQTR